MLGLSLGAGGSVASTSTIITPVISISHSNGAADSTYNSGGGESNFGSLGAGSGGGAVITHTGTWQSLLTSGQIVSLKVKSNIVAADISSAGGEDISITVYNSYVISSGNVTTGARNSVSAGKINDHGVALAAGPSYSTPGDIGDIGTFVQESVDLNQAFGSPKLVVGTNYLDTPVMNGLGIISPGYWSYGFTIHADWPTKVYKFQLELEVET